MKKLFKTTNNIESIIVMMAFIFFISVGATSILATTDGEIPPPPQVKIPDTHYNGNTDSESNCCSCHQLSQLNEWMYDCNGNTVFYWESGITFGR